jgi:hypothetical protein
VGYPWQSGLQNTDLAAKTQGKAGILDFRFAIFDFNKPRRSIANRKSQI